MLVADDDRMVVAIDYWSVCLDQSDFADRAVVLLLVREVLFGVFCPVSNTISISRSK